MAKYNLNAGFKNYNEPDEITEEEVSEKPKSLLQKLKFPLLFGGSAIVVLTLIVVLMVVFSDNQPKPVEEATTTVAETFDYYEVFGTTRATIYVPPTTIAPVTQSVSTKAPEVETTQKKEEKNDKEDKSDKSSNNNSNNNNSNNNLNNNSNYSNNSSNHSNNSSNYSNHSSNNNSNNNSNNSNSGGSSGGNSGGGGTNHYAQPVMDNAPKTIAVTGVSISDNSISLIEGQNATLSASISPSNATNKTITWSSQNSSVATVSGGNVHAVNAGTTQIYVISNNGIKAVCTVIVVKKAEPVDNVRLVAARQTIKVGTIVTIELEGASKCTWNISNTFVATKVRSSNDYITIRGAKAGLTNVEATLPNGKVYKIKITVV